MPGSRFEQFGTQRVVDWIAAGTHVGPAITSLIPPQFESYATIVIPEPKRRPNHQAIVLDVLSRHSTNRCWWLGYLDTGAADLDFPGAPRVSLYANWAYVLTKGGPHQATRRPSIPDLIFPTDRSWLLSKGWDDDWRCLGGPRDLIDSLTGDVRLHVRAIDTRQSATPPGHATR